MPSLIKAVLSEQGAVATASCVLVRTLIVMGLLWSLSISVRAQEHDKWRRVYTGDESVIDLNVSSITFGEKRILRVEFRTVFSKPESLREKPGTKFKSRLETIGFDPTKKLYRIYEIRFLDSAGNTLHSYEPSSSEDWKVVKVGGMTQRMLDAVGQLPPLGEWKVVDYRFADGAPVNAQEYSRLIGTRVTLNLDKAAVGTKVCSLPAYQSRRLTEEEFVRELGFSLKSIGIAENNADTIAVKCEANNWEPPQSLLVKLPEGGILMLWEGVFLVLKQ